MTNQQTKQQQLFQPREDRKVQKLVERIEQKQALQAKGIREQDHPAHHPEANHCRRKSDKAPFWAIHTTPPERARPF